MHIESHNICTHMLRPEKLPLSFEVCGCIKRIWDHNIGAVVFQAPAVSWADASYQPFDLAWLFSPVGVLHAPQCLSVQFRAGLSGGNLGDAGDLRELQLSRLAGLESGMLTCEL